MSASWQARVAAFVVRRRVKPALGDMSDIARVRRAFGAPLPAPGGVRYRQDMLGGVPGEWVEAEGAAPAADTLLYLHGGGFIGCSPRTHRPLTAALARQGLRLFVPDYRLAPGHPFPAAPDDVRWLCGGRCGGAAGEWAPGGGRRQRWWQLALGADAAAARRRRGPAGCRRRVLAGHRPGGRQRLDHAQRRTRCHVPRPAPRQPGACLPR